MAMIGIQVRNFLDPFSENEDNRGVSFSEIVGTMSSKTYVVRPRLLMDLVSSSVEPTDFFLEPIQYVFRDGSADWVVTFVPTVPHGCEAVHLFGDLFDCCLRDINYDTKPIPIGSDTERAIINQLQAFADSHKSADEQHMLLHGKFPRMDGEMVGWRTMLWLIGALRNRSGTGV